MRDWLDINRVVEMLKEFGNTAGPFTAICGLAIASALAVPLGVMTVIAIVAFGPLYGFTYTLTGACLGGAASYSLGRHLGHEAVDRLAGESLKKISRRLAHHGILSVIAIRLIPVAPFAIVNMLAGASHIRFRDFILGTLIGMIPGTIAIIVFTDQIIKAIREPGESTILIAGITLGLITAGFLVLRKWLKKNDD